MVVWYVNVETITENDIEHYSTLLPLSFKAEIFKYKFLRDRRLALVSKLLLRHAILTNKNDKNLLNTLQKDSNRKPFIKNWENFNISHSGSYVILAFDKISYIGIDIEEVPNDLNKYYSIISNFSIGEQKFINESSEKNAILDIWVKKEAVLKAIGTGIVNGLTQFSCITNTIKYEGKTWFLTKLNISDKYISYLATDIFFTSIKIEEIKYEDIIK